ncbi:hypothetical protein BGZ94_008455 [Podila epigama]|nr:hypothetical protein BGZ94_008455 [Podila epigama]
MTTVKETLANLDAFSSLPLPDSPLPTFLGIELTYHHRIFFRAIVFSFLVQFAFFYITRRLIPSLSTNNKALSWVCTLWSATIVSIAGWTEAGLVRTTIFERLGMDSVSLGLPIDSTLFSYLAPKFNAWVMNLGSGYIQGSSNGLDVVLDQIQGWNTESLTILSGTFLRWLVQLPIFSLAPLPPVDPSRIVEGAPYYFGGGGRLLLSMADTHTTTALAALTCGYFVGYFTADLTLGVMYYRRQIDPLAGWIHHICHSCIIFSFARMKHLSIFAICAGTLEPPTAILAAGYVFPGGRNNFVFGTSFMSLRIILNILYLHEFYYNHSPKSNASTTVLTVCLTMHIYWFSTFIQGLLRRSARASKEKAIAAQKKLQEQTTSEKTTIATSANSSSIVQLRVKSRNDKRRE